MRTKTPKHTPAWFVETTIWKNFGGLLLRLKLQQYKWEGLACWIGNKQRNGGSRQVDPSKTEVDISQTVDRLQKLKFENAITGRQNTNFLPETFEILTYEMNNRISRELDGFMSTVNVQITSAIEEAIGDQVVSIV